MNELALFAGAGGGILGGHLLGWRTVCAVEWEQYPASVLCARQNDGLLPPFPIWDDVQTFDGRPWRGIVQVVSGGFPCQDISSAGKGAGISGERSSMWKHMARIIGEVRPEYAFVENSPMLTVRGLGVVLGDLSEMGYDCRWGVVSAADVGANHKRDRIWIVAHSNGNRQSTSTINDKEAKESNNLGNTNNDGHTTTQIRESTIERGNCSKARKEQTCQLEGSGKQHENMANTDNNGHNYSQSRELSEGSEQTQTRQKLNEIGRHNSLAYTTGIRPQGQRQHEQPFCAEESGDWKTNLLESISRPEFWAVEPNVGRVAHGVASRVDRLKAIGNGQVPLCAATAWKLLTQGDY